MTAVIDTPGRHAGSADSRLTAGFAVSLLLHAVVTAGISSLPRSGGRPAGDATLPRLTAVLADARPARQQVHNTPALPPPQPAVARQQARDERVATEEAGSPAVPASAVQIPLPPPEPQFFALAELDAPPTVLQDIENDPPELRQYPQGGRLVLQLWIDQTGRVVRAEALSSVLPEPFVASARENFMRAIFNPAKKDGVAVRARVSVEIVYRSRL